MNGGHGLEQADGQTHDHGCEQDGRGNSDGLKDHVFQQFNGKFRIHKKTLAPGTTC
jgi:hypothetical protein